jgi:hypothetical protein
MLVTTMTEQSREYGREGKVEVWPKVGRNGWLNELERARGTRKNGREETSRRVIGLDECTAVSESEAAAAVRVRRAAGRG